MKETVIAYNLDVRADWVKEIGKQLRARIVTDEMGSCTPGVKLFLPQQVGKGGVFFMQLEENLAGFYINVEYYKPYRFIPMSREGEFITVHFLILDSSIMEQAPGERGDMIQEKVSGKITIKDGAMSTFFDGNKATSQHALRIIIKRAFALKLARLIFDNKTVKRIFIPGKDALFRQLDMDQQSMEIIKTLESRGLDDPAFRLHFAGSVYALLANLFERLRIRSVVKTGWLMPADIAALEHTLSYMMDRLEDPFPQLETLASMAHMSVSKYRKAFSRMYHIPPMKYFNIRKLELAREMLISGNYRVEEVVRRLNYSNPGLFAVRFTRHFGIRPGEIAGAGRRQP